MTTTPALTCVIPAFNEAPRIGAVLAAALAAAEIDEVIVVDDGSTDTTARVVEDWKTRHPRLRLIRQPENRGKSRAVVAGLRAARGTYLMLIDSDLTGLASVQLSRLAVPVIAGRADASISLRGNAPLGWRALGIDYISGERVMPRAVLADQLEALEQLPRFGLEVFMNRLWLDEGFTIAVVRWPQVASPVKSAKCGGVIAGLKADIAMMADIFRTITPVAALGQIREMRARRI
jgi:glycosyltransferase involved in cell wall biosynthesis